MASIGDTTRPAFAYDQATDTWVPVGIGPHSHTAAGVGAVATSSFAAKGDLLVGTGAGTLVAQSVGANGTVLTADSTQADGVIWATPAAGGMTLLSTINASAATSVSFTSIPSTYTNLLLTWERVYSSLNDSYWWGIRFNNDTDVDNHVTNGIYYAGSVTFTGSYDNKIGSNFADAPLQGGYNVSTDQGYNGFGAITIYNYSDGSRGTSGKYSSGNRNSAGNYQWNDVNFVYEPDTAISRIDFIRNSSQTVTGTFRLYGVK